MMKTCFLFFTPLHTYYSTLINFQTLLLIGGLIRSQILFSKEAVHEPKQKLHAPPARRLVTDLVADYIKAGMTDLEVPPATGARCFRSLAVSRLRRLLAYRCRPRRHRQVVVFHM